MNEPGAIYLSLKIAAQLFSKPLDALAPDERQRVSRVAAKQQEIEALILKTREAASVVLPEATVAANLLEIRNRYNSEEEYLGDLARNGLQAGELRHAVERDLVVESVLERVASRSALVSDTDVEIFWLMHKERFHRAETRTLRHILITINEALAGSERITAREKIESIRNRLLKEPQRFAEQALKHSECPTAMNGGLLGKVPRGQLYPELDAEAFKLAEATLSDVIESEIGFHLIYCEAIDVERPSRLDETRTKIREHLLQQRRSLCQKSWINALRLSAR